MSSANGRLKRLENKTRVKDTVQIELVWADERTDAPRPTHDKDGNRIQYIDLVWRDE